MRAKFSAFALALVLCAAAAVGSALGQANSGSTPLRFIVPFAAGGGTDVVARILAEELSKSLGRQVFVDNRPGANGIIGTQAGLQAAPDGNTILLALEATIAINPGLYKGATYKPEDFQPVSLVSKHPYMVVVGPSVKAANLGELIQQAKQQPGKLNYATGASAAFLAAEFLKSTAGIDILNVPYKGSGPAITDLLGGRIDVMVSSPVSVLPLIQADKIRSLAVTSANRFRLTPDVPTVAEQGYPGFDAAGWYGVVAPAKTPIDFVQKLNEEIAKALQAPDVIRQFEKVGVEPNRSSPDEFGKHMRNELDRWAPVIRRAGLSPE